MHESPSTRSSASTSSRSSDAERQGAPSARRATLLGGLLLGCAVLAISCITLQYPGPCPPSQVVTVNQGAYPVAQPPSPDVADGGVGGGGPGDGCREMNAQEVTIDNSNRHWRVGQTCCRMDRTPPTEHSLKKNAAGTKWKCG